MFEAAKITVYRRKNIRCGHSFYETDGNEQTWCPHCHKSIMPEDVVDVETIQHEVLIDPATGEIDLY
jgi:hypothetical protein